MKKLIFAQCYFEPLGTYDCPAIHYAHYTISIDTKAQAISV